MLIITGEDKKLEVSIQSLLGNSVVNYKCGNDIRAYFIPKENPILKIEVDDLVPDKLILEIDSRDKSITVKKED